MREKYEKDCPGCMPVVLDPVTGKINEEVTAKARKFWETVSEADKLAFHAVCCTNSRDQGDLARVKDLSERMSRSC